MHLMQLTCIWCKEHDVACNIPSNAFFLHSMYHLQDIWVKLKKMPIDLLHMFIFLFREAPKLPIELNPPQVPSPKSSTKPISYKTHRIQAVVERTFAGKTTCNSIPRLGGQAKVFFQHWFFFGAIFVVIFLCGWTSQDGFVDFCEDDIFIREFAKIYMAVAQPSFLVWVFSGGTLAPQRFGRLV